MDGVEIPIGAADAGLNAAMSAASRAIAGLRDTFKTLAGPVDAAGKKTAEAERATKKYTDAAYALNKAAQITGGGLSFMTGPLDDLGDLLERGNVKMAALAIGSVAAVGGMYAVGRAAVAAGEALYDTAANATKLIDELEAGGRTILPAHRDALLEAESATRGLDGAMLDLQLTLAGALSPTLTGITDTVSGLVIGLTNVVDATSSWATEIDLALDQLSPMYKTVSLLAGGVSALLGATGSLGEATREQADAERERQEAGAKYMADLQKQLDADIAAEGQAKKTTAAIRERTTATKEAGGITFSAEELGADGITQSSASLTELATSMGTVVESPFWNLEFAAAFNQTNAELDALPDKLGRTTEEWNAYYDNLAARSAAWGANAKAVSASVFSVIADLAVKRTDSERKAARKRAIIMKAAAITEATINTFVATTKALASSSPPVNFILAGLTAAFGAVQIGLIAAKPLVYHTGGMLDPDEERLNATSAVVRKNESIGVVTGQGRAAVDTAMSRLNAGQVSTGDTYLLVDGDLFGTRRVAGPNPGYGRSGRR